MTHTIPSCNACPVTSGPGRTLRAGFTPLLNLIRNFTRFFAVYGKKPGSQMPGTYLFPAIRVNLARIVYPGPGKRPEKHMEFPAGRIENSGGGFYMRFSGNYPAPADRRGPGLPPPPPPPAEGQNVCTAKRCRSAGGLFVSRADGMFEPRYGCYPGKHLLRECYTPFPQNTRQDTRHTRR
jgi:hypothetical protein